MTNEEKKKMLKRAKWEKEFCEKVLAQESATTKEGKEFAERQLKALNILIPKMEREVK